MREVTTVTKLYEIDELSEESQKKALDNLRDINVDYEGWHDWLIDDFKTDLESKGYSNIEVFYSGFWSQGDGASFTANVDIEKWIQMQKGDYKNLLRDLKNGACPNIVIKKQGNYEHSNTMYIDSETGGVDDDALDEFTKLETDVLEYSKGLADKFYKNLESAYEDLRDDEQVKETIYANECEFTSDGVLTRL